MTGGTRNGTAEMIGEANRTDSTDEEVETGGREKVKRLATVETRGV